MNVMPHLRSVKGITSVYNSVYNSGQQTITADKRVLNSLSETLRLH